MYLVISLLVLGAGYGIWLYQFLIIAYPFTFRYNTIDTVFIFLVMYYGLDIYNGLGLGSQKCSNETYIWLHPYILNKQIPIYGSWNSCNSCISNMIWRGCAILRKPVEAAKRQVGRRTFGKRFEYVWLYWMAIYVVQVNRLGSLPRKSVVRLNDSLDMM